MQHRAEEPSIVRCPGCHRPMDAQERTLVTVRLVDIRYVCATCGMETKRTVVEDHGARSLMQASKPRGGTKSRSLRASAGAAGGVRGGPRRAGSGRAH